MCVTTDWHELFVVYHLLSYAKWCYIYTSWLVGNHVFFTLISSSWHAVYIAIMRTHLHITALLTWKKNEITALITTSMTWRYQAVDVVPIITYNVRGSHTNCFKCNEIFTFPSKYFSSIHFEPLRLSVDEARAPKENHHVIVCVCGLTLHCVHVWAGCIWGLCLSFVFLPQIELDSYARYPVIEHKCTDKERRKGIKCFV